MKIKTNIFPRDEPVTLNDALLHLRVDDPYENPLITLMISAAREWCEAYTNRKFITETIALNIEGIEQGVQIPIEQDFKNLVRVQSGSVILDESAYSINGIFITFNLPITSVELVFETGYGPNPSDVPASIKNGILMLLGTLYEQRLDVSFNVNVIKAPVTSIYLLNPHRLF